LRWLVHSAAQDRAKAGLDGLFVKGVRSRHSSSSP
jgi:hypothetical protein